VPRKPTTKTVTFADGSKSVFNKNGNGEGTLYVQESKNAWRASYADKRPGCYPRLRGRSVSGRVAIGQVRVWVRDRGWPGSWLGCGQLLDRLLEDVHGSGDDETDGDQRYR